MNGERLHLAAQELDARVNRDVRYYTSNGEQHPPACFTCDEDRAEAALLREMAAFQPWVVAGEQMHHLWIAAHALADAILGEAT